MVMTRVHRPGAEALLIVMLAAALKGKCFCKTMLHEVVHAGNYWGIPEAQVDEAAGLMWDYLCGGTKVCYRHGKPSLPSNFDQVVAPWR